MLIDASFSLLFFSFSLCHLSSSRAVPRFSPGWTSPWLSLVIAYTIHRLDLYFIRQAASAVQHRPKHPPRFSCATCCAGNLCSRIIGYSYYSNITCYYSNIDAAIYSVIWWSVVNLHALCWDRFHLFSYQHLKRNYVTATKILFVEDEKLGNN